MLRSVFHFFVIVTVRGMYIIIVAFSRRSIGLIHGKLKASKDWVILFAVVKEEYCIETGLCPLFRTNIVDEDMNPIFKSTVWCIYLAISFRGHLS